MFTTRSHDRKAPATRPPTAVGPAWREAAVVLLYHGSPARPEAAAAAKDHAARLAEPAVFAEVATGALNGPHSVEAALAGVKAATVFLVPLFMSEGDMVRRAIPDRLRLDGPVTHIGHRTIHYCAPVGTHPALAGIVAARVRRACREHVFDPAATRVLLIGHGSRANPASSRAAADCAASLSVRDEFAAIDVAFLEEAPFLADYIPAASGPTVACGLFACRGTHAERDVRQLLRVSSAGTIAGPRSPPPVYAGPIGTDPAIVGIVTARIEETGIPVGAASPANGVSLSNGTRQT